MLFRHGHVEGSVGSFFAVRKQKRGLHVTVVSLKRHDAIICRTMARPCVHRVGLSVFLPRTRSSTTGSLTPFQSASTLYFLQPVVFLAECQRQTWQHAIWHTCALQTKPLKRHRVPCTSVSHERHQLLAAPLFNERLPFRSLPLRIFDVQLTASLIQQHWDRIWCHFRSFLSGLSEHCSVFDLLLPGAFP